MKSRDESRIIDFTRILVMGGVILIHCNISSFLGDGEDMNRAAGLIEFISVHICYICVPMFFFISGLLFFKDWSYSLSSYKSKFKRRLRSLLIPYLIWCFIGLLLFLIKTSASGSTYFPLYADADVSFPKILEGFWSIDLLGVPNSTHPFNFALWFVRDLWVCVMLVPLLQLCFKLSWGWLIIALLISRIKFYGMEFAILYFSFGALCSIRRLPFIAICRPRKVWLTALCLYLAIELVGFIWLADIVNEIKPIVTTVGFIGLFGLAGELYPLLRYPFTRLLLSSLFFIYAFHALWVNVLIKSILALVNPGGSLSAMACYILIFIIQWTVGLFLFSILQKYCPSLVSLMSGGRNKSPEASTLSRGRLADGTHQPSTTDGIPYTGR